MTTPDLTAFPRVRLGHWPTPLERCDRLSAELGGPRIWIKRDDCTGLAAGGNKTRKLEYLLGRALAEGHHTVVTFGAVQSNHARQTAAACARLGLRCELLLTRSVPRSDELYETSGNVLLDGLLGARVRIVDDADDIAAALEEIGPAYVIPPGGSNAVGALGYVGAALELLTQIQPPPETARPDQGAGPQEQEATRLESKVGPAGAVDRVVVATSTAGTAAGLAVGLAEAGSAAQVEAVAVYRPAEETRAVVEELTAETARLLGVPVPEDRVTVHGDWLGPGYGVVTPEMSEAVRLFARTEGVLLDPVYSGKAAAALVGLVRAGRIGADETVVFWHTGGLPGLFVYPDAFVG
ncbi:D-cysteine desulfhydrase [Thermomonospora echinospora]|uniref:D-cysteine desulfhydrase n=1 Tax=Thermomonospora echinospora TaxID=1992 RepID=A0A1H5V5N6_9ACTN|nr:D-cysteine desulfhydrase family protein [Thermomonospora echinospora]SEF82068.1 D-cysteine desulfhydrase [Thermomonospora echinospora]